MIHAFQKGNADDTDQADMASNEHSTDVTVVGKSTIDLLLHLFQQEIPNFITNLILLTISLATQTASYQLFIKTQN